MIITAAHCLPLIPPCGGATFLEERTYKALLGPLGEAPTVCAECRFAEPIGDIAVLGPPDSQALSDENDAYEALLEDLPLLPIADVPGGPPWRLTPDGWLEAAPEQHTPAWMLSLDGQWLSCSVHHLGGPLLVVGAEIRGGMSGSPIITDDGAVEVVSLGGSQPQGPNARLTQNLPGWLLSVQAAEGPSRQAVQSVR